MEDIYIRIGHREEEEEEEEEVGYTSTYEMCGELGRLELD